MGRMAGRLDFTRFFPGLGAHVGPGWAGAWQGELGDFQRLSQKSAELKEQEFRKQLKPMRIKKDHWPGEVAVSLRSSALDKTGASAAMTFFVR